MSDASLPEQLLSAFVDGQLNGREKQHVEDLIAADPRVAEWVEQCRAHGVALRELPRFRLDRDFSDRVLNEHECADPVVGSNSAYGSKPLAKIQSGRAAAATILALAAMILFTLFVLPMPRSEVREVALNKSQNEAEMSVPASRFEMEASGQGQTPSKGEVAVDLSEPFSGVEPVEGENEAELGRDSKLDRRELERAAREMSAAVDEQRLVEKEALRTKIEPPELALETKDLRISDRVEVAAAELEKQNLSAKIVPMQNIDEVWFFDMKVENPLERLKLALRENRIQLDARTVANSSREKSPGMEAVYLLTTNSQLRGAIAMLTDDADILAYSIPEFQEMQLQSNSQYIGVQPEELDSGASRLAAQPLTDSAPDSLAQHLDEEFNLLKEADRKSKIRTLFMGTVFSAPESVAKDREKKNSDEPRAGLVKEENDSPIESNGGVAPADVSEGELKWYEEELADRNNGKAKSSAAESISDSRLADVKPEKQKRFLLLIRFDNKLKTELAPPAPAEPTLK